VLNKSLNFIVSLEGQDAFGRDSGVAVVQAPPSLPRAPRHFYGVRELSAGAPVWAEGRAPVDLPPTFDVEADRFRFFSGGI